MPTDKDERRPRLLLLEDSQVEAENLIAWLGTRFAIAHVTSVLAATNLLRQSPFDVALIDLCVDDSRGMNTFITCHDAAPHVPFVVQSGLDEDELALGAVTRGAQDYLVKRTFNAEIVRRSLCYAIERFRIEAEVRESRERYRLAVAGANDGIWDWNITRKNFVVSTRWCEMLGYAPLEFGGEAEDWLALVHPSDCEEVWDALQAHLQGHTPHYEIEHRIQHKGGGWRWVRTRGLCVRNPDGLATRIAGSQADVTERRNFEARLRREATTDGLTGLANRSAFVERLRGAVARSALEPLDRCAVVFLDVDRFKVVNDSLGHHVGDRLLVAIGQRLRISVRPEDLVARFGGDEFALLVENIQSLAQVEDLAARIHRTVSTPYNLGAHPLHASVSVGIVFDTHNATSAEEVLKNADIAMYRSKRAGRGCTVVFSQADAEEAAVRLSLETGLRRALQHGELEMHYQPIVRIPSSELIGFEALVRWRAPDGRLIPPAEFIPVAEETGLITELGAWALQASCEYLAELTRVVPEAGALSVSVNVSPREFARDGFLPTVERVLATSRLAPHRLALEITEGALIEEPIAAARTLERLRSLGVRVVLDDFGIGYSSLGFLRRFPIDCLKIDRSFTQAVSDQHEDTAIVCAILTLAAALGLDVVAEGVETEEQCSRLVGLHCAYAQGFYFSRPLDGPHMRSLAADGFGPSCATPIRAHRVDRPRTLDAAPRTARVASTLPD